MSDNLYPVGKSTVNIQSGKLSLFGKIIRRTIDETVIPAIDDKHAHEIWSTVIAGFDASDAFENIESFPGYRTYRTKGSREYLSVFIGVE